jgi:hypothetical protein
VIAVDISSDPLDDLATALSNTEVVTVAGDITQQADIDRVVGTAGSRIDGPGERHRRERRLLPRT